jgi:flagellar basal body-associated protein FliL
LNTCGVPKGGTVDELIHVNLSSNRLSYITPVALSTLLLPTNNVLSENGNLHIFIKFVQTNSKLGERLEEHVTLVNERSLSKLADDMKSLLRDPTGSDFKIETREGRIFNVHKAILAGKELFT